MGGCLDAAAHAAIEADLCRVSGTGFVSIGLGSVGARHSAQRQYAVRDREQRRLRPHQGTVFGLGGFGTKAKRGDVNQSRRSIRLLALSLGATFVARSFSGDKAQLVR